MRILSLFQFSLANVPSVRGLHSPSSRVALPSHTALLSTSHHGDRYRAHTRLKALAASSLPPQRLQVGPLMHYVDGRELDDKVWPIIKEMLRHVWPKDQPALKARVVAAVGLLLGSKVIRCGAYDMITHTTRTYTQIHTHTHTHTHYLKLLHIVELRFAFFSWI